MQHFFFLRDLFFEGFEDFSRGEISLPKTFAVPLLL
jgi:hypothetical protein